MNLFEYRREYTNGELNEADMLTEPLDQFEHWLKYAVEQGMQDATAMVLSTVNTDGQPNARNVLLKNIEPDGLVFFTSLASQKALEIKHNHKVCLLFNWLTLDRQVKIQGIAEPLAAEVAKNYHMGRPRESQISSWLASVDAGRFTTKQALLYQFEVLKQKFKNKQVPMPESWGGYIVKPQHFEFWQGGKGRLHDRIIYFKKDSDGWQRERIL
ncbi:pyridoxamine 5'-phosphate oxidase [Catenovulum agarivorans DS-2]|uniref:Pyridoxamine 5'-phosphate oxidase n=1 Tax=Catenovulum agarivorans DS-2 TaxID=1328313 RepID=W7QJ85_9ALTE|nr:pyridoxamine 5'-phosphate oxidase [Catenovulum agarivorans]EWH11941.1 pyridoxamine 5'-phosphate oxidase [Catenovulum agarivorans DS-2]